MCAHNRIMCKKCEIVLPSQEVRHRLTSQCEDLFAYILFFVKMHGYFSSFCIYQVVSISFTSVQTDIAEDKLDVYDGDNPSASLIINLSGNRNKPSRRPTYYTTQRYMFVQFQSGLNSPIVGFIANFSSILISNVHQCCIGLWELGTRIEW